MLTTLLVLTTQVGTAFQGPSYCSHALFPRPVCRAEPLLCSWWVSAKVT